MDSSNKLSEDFDLLKFGVGGYMDALEDISEPSGFMDSNTGGPSAGSSMSDMNSVYNNSKPCKPSNNHFGAYLRVNILLLSVLNFQELLTLTAIMNQYA